MFNFNSKEYTYCDVKVFIFGQLVGAMRGVEYKTKKNKEALFGMGREARAIQHGKREVEGTVTVFQSVLIALDRAAQLKGYKDILDVDMDVVVCYLSSEGILTTDRIVGVSFTETPRAMKEGDMFMEVALPFIALDVEQNII